MRNDRQKIARPFLLAIALLGWFALIAQLYININSKINPLPETLTRYFSYFTIDTNLIVALCCSFILLAAGSVPGKFFSRQSTQTAITIYIIIVGIVYNIVLRQIWKPEGLQKIVDELLHLIIPILFLLYWLFFVQKNELKWRHAFSWMIYPLLYGIFVFCRGYASGFYPYPFIDMSILGMNQTIINSIGFVFVFLIAGIIFIGIGRLMSKKKMS